jgi:delta 1-pyrroline-5-carboxylate dehydrogenase
MAARKPRKALQQRGHIEGKRGRFDEAGCGKTRLQQRATRRDFVCLEPVDFCRAPRALELLLESRNFPFGPVAALTRFTDEDEAVERCNATEYGLVAYVFTGNLKRGLAFSEKLDFGMIGLNRGLVSDPAAPFGGMKQSGIGREGAHYGIMEFLETQYISVEW